MDSCYFQDDDARCHVSRATMQWYADNNVRRLYWPAQSPDLDPTEDLCDELDRRVRARQARPKSIAQLMEWLQEEWRRIPVDVLQTLVESMPDMVAAVTAERENVLLETMMHAAAIWSNFSPSIANEVNFYGCVTRNCSITRTQQLQKWNYTAVHASLACKMGNDFFTSDCGEKSMRRRWPVAMPLHKAYVVQSIHDYSVYVRSGVALLNYGPGNALQEQKCIVLRVSLPHRYILLVKRDRTSNSLLQQRITTHGAIGLSCEASVDSRAGMEGREKLADQWRRPAPIPAHAPYSPHFTIIGSQDLDAKRPVIDDGQPERLGQWSSTFEIPARFLIQSVGSQVQSPGISHVGDMADVAFGPEEDLDFRNWGGGRVMSPVTHAPSGIPPLLPPALSGEVFSGYPRCASLLYACKLTVLDNASVQAIHGLNCHAHQVRHRRYTQGSELACSVNVVLRVSMIWNYLLAIVTNFTGRIVARCHVGVLVRILAFHQGELCSIPSGVAQRFSRVEIVPDDAAGRRVFSGTSRFSRPCTPVLLHTRPALPSSALEALSGPLQFTVSGIANKKKNYDAPLHVHDVHNCVRWVWTVKSRPKLFAHSLQSNMYFTVLRSPDSGTPHSSTRYPHSLVAEPSTVVYRYSATKGPYTIKKTFNTLLYHSTLRSLLGMLFRMKFGTIELSSIKSSTVNIDLEMLSRYTTKMNCEYDDLSLTSANMEPRPASSPPDCLQCQFCD
ncbi:hypothetical protein PR048_033245 [Dryococelus australis]|uniref:Uncharacterized protein n=1 Tax=Dryococelus australis TaxID=614101 RepID=A0ABQ9G3Y8_9NEOP|nr:hypothetical protein PR048_033245 [Dryococelus australis]